MAWYKVICKEKDRSDEMFFVLSKPTAELIGIIVEDFKRIKRCRNTQVVKLKNSPILRR